LPHNATVIVASKGDADLLSLYGRDGWHFPQTENGVYGGHHPASSTAAIVHIERLRAKGAEYFLLPNTMFWWLDHYVGFRRYLETYYRVVVKREDACMIFGLQGARALPSERPSWQSQFREAIASFQTQFGQMPSILDWNTGLNLTSKFPELTIFAAQKTDQALPYIDESVDMVAVASWEFLYRSEAQRVAKAGVMKFSKMEDGSRHESKLETEWKPNLPIAAEKLAASIVIPSCNVAETQKCLTAVLDTLPRNFTGEIILVDWSDGEPNALSHLAKFDSAIKICQHRETKSFLAACNSGAKAAAGDVLVFVNTAVLPVAGWLPALLQIFRDYPHAGAAGAKHMYSDGKLQEAGGVVFSNGSISGFGNSDYLADAPLYNFVREVDFCSLTLLATRRSLFEELHGFRTEFDSSSYAAADYGLRVRGKGVHVYYQPESTAVQAGNGSAITESSRHDEMHLRSRSIFIDRWSEVLKRRPAPPPVLNFGTWQHLVGELE